MCRRQTTNKKRWCVNPTSNLNLNFICWRKDFQSTNRRPCLGCSPLGLEALKGKIARGNKEPSHVRVNNSIYLNGFLNMEVLGSNSGVQGQRRRAFPCKNQLPGRSGVEVRGKLFVVTLLGVNQGSTDDKLGWFLFAALSVRDQHPRAETTLSGKHNQATS